MASKKLKKLTDIGLGLAAAYGASKLLGQKSPMEIAKLEGAEAVYNQMGGPDSGAIIKPPEMSREDSVRMANQANQEDALRSKWNRSSTIGERFQQRINNLRRKSDSFIEAQYNTGVPYTTAAKKGKMIKASKGGSVVAKGNKLAKSKPTKLY